MERIDAIARGLASGMSRREALRAGGLALAGAAAITPTDAWARLTGHCPHGHKLCAGRCCPPGEVCLPPARKGGKHKCGCPAHKHRCGSKCVDVHADPHNCGRCGNACAPGETCANGICQPAPCPTGQIRCGGTCVDTASDPSNCGQCGLTCQSGQVCSSGQCTTQCAAGQTNCGGACIDLQSSTAHCGACGTACPTGGICNSGQCGCPAGMTNCGGACVDTNSDFHNCGACGTVCSSYFASSSCQSGTCHIDSCSPNWQNCDGNPLTGCEYLGASCPP